MFFSRLLTVEAWILSHSSPCAIFRGHWYWVFSGCSRYFVFPPIPVATTSKPWVCGHSPAGIAGSNLAGNIGWLSLLLLCLSALGWSIIQRSPTECGESECDREDSIMRGPWPTRGCVAMGPNNKTLRFSPSGSFHQCFIRHHSSPTLCTVSRWQCQ